MPEEAEHTVYLIGAGASHASSYRLPLMGNFFASSDLEASEFSHLRKYLSLRWPTPAEANLEDAITELHLQAEDFPRHWSEAATGQAPQAFAEALRFIQRRVGLSEVPLSAEAARTHAELLLRNTGRDLYITLNYDPLIERAAHRVASTSGRNAPSVWASLVTDTQRMWDQPGHGTPPSIRARHAMTPWSRLVKLHGSCDWYSCSRPDCPYSLEIYFTPIGEKPKPEGNWCNLCSADMRPVIVPPTATKNFTGFPRLQLQWRTAFAGLREADRLVVIGLSLAPTDYSLAWLIWRSLLENQKLREIHVADPGAVCNGVPGDILTRLRNLLANSPSSESAAVMVWPNLEAYVSPTDSDHEWDFCLKSGELRSRA